jgi:hypothetical protein
MRYITSPVRATPVPIESRQLTDGSAVRYDPSICTVCSVEQEFPSLEKFQFKGGGIELFHKYDICCIKGGGEN